MGPLNCECCDIPSAVQTGKKEVKIRKKKQKTCKKKLS